MKNYLKTVQTKYPCAVLIDGKFKEYDLFIPEKNKKIEIKGDYRSCETGNIIIELMMFDKPSALLTTKADYWIQIFSDGPDDFCRLIFDTSTVKRLARKYKHTARYGGDYNKSRFVLIPLKDLFKRENTKHVRKKDDD